MNNILKKLIVKKKKGQSDLICSLFVVMALIVVLFLAVSTTQDISKVTLVDQVARQGIIKLETQGSLDNSQLGAIKSNLSASGLQFNDHHAVSVNGASVKDGVYTAYKSGGKWKIDTGNNHIFQYGEEVGLYIQCQANTMKFGGNIFGNSLTKGNLTTITRLKASITKKAKQ